MARIGKTKVTLPRVKRWRKPIGKKVEDIQPEKVTVSRISLEEGARPIRYNRYWAVILNENDFLLTDDGEVRKFSSYGQAYYRARKYNG